MSNSIFDLFAHKDDIILYYVFEKINGVISKHHIKEYKNILLQNFELCIKKITLTGVINTIPLLDFFPT